MRNKTYHGLLSLVLLTTPFVSTYGEEDEKFCISLTGIADTQPLAELQIQYTLPPLPSDYTQQLGVLTLRYESSRQERRQLRRKVRKGTASWQEIITVQLAKEGLNASVFGAITGTDEQGLPGLTHRYVATNGTMVSIDQITSMSGFTECSIDIEEDINIIAGELTFVSKAQGEFVVSVTAEGYANGSISNGVCPGQRNQFDVDIDLCFTSVP